jgi:hypothetical protein
MTELGRHFEKTMSPMMKKLLPAAFTWAFKSIPQVTDHCMYLCIWLLLAGSCTLYQIIGVPVTMNRICTSGYSVSMC